MSTTKIIPFPAEPQHFRTPTPERLAGRIIAFRTQPVTRAETSKKVLQLYVPNGAA